jgi:p-cumate 2,3-dioxygenase subunit alpha
VNIPPPVIPDGLVIDDLEKGIFRVNRRVFTDPAILDAERRLVFDQSWLYVGHESEVSGRGAYVKRKVGGRPVILVRDDAGKVRVFFDACTHRGNSVCRGSRGTTSRFLCFYHGWTFNTRGELINVPDQVGYGDKLDRSRLGLGSPPRLESYRGLVFMSMKHDIVDLQSYLGDTRPYIDDMLDMTDSAPVIAPGQQSYSMKANWKMLVENSADAYHGPFTHQRFFQEYVASLGADTKIWQQTLRGSNPENHVIAFENGHAVIDVPAGPLPLFAQKPEILRELREKLTATYGPERVANMLDRSRNLLIFPNLVMISNWRTIRTFYPVTPDYMEVDSWAIVGMNDAPDLREIRFGNFISFLGPAGFGTPDDVEALENCQKAFATTEMAWTDLSKGMGREGGAMANDELQMRTIWRKWYSLMNKGFVPSNERSHCMMSAADQSHGKALQ